MKKFVRPNYRGKKNEKVVINAACQGDITAYVKHQPTGALIPVKPEAVRRMKAGETVGLEETERLHDRFYFKIPALAERWGMEKPNCFAKLIELEVPCFFNPNQVPIEGNEAKVGQDDVCVYQEYVEAVEKKKVKKVKDVQPEFI